MAVNDRLPLGFENFSPKGQGTEMWRQPVSLEDKIVALGNTYFSLVQTLRIQVIHVQIPEPQKQ